jgi:hypothetical protein
VAQARLFVNPHLAHLLPARRRTDNQSRNGDERVSTMNTAVQLIVSLITLVVTFFFFWVAFSFVLPPGPFRSLRPLGSLACAILIAQYVSRRTGASSGGLVKCMCLSGFVTGVIGFSAGFFGPIIFTPESNQGPLLGIFITGPLSFVAGAIGGAIYWSVTEKRRRDNQV